MSLSEKQRLFAAELNAFLRWASLAGYGYRYGDAWRSTDPLKCPNCQKETTYQDMLVFNKRSKVKHSKHNDRLAVDLIFSRGGVDLKPEEYLPLGLEWELRGGRWGGRFGETPGKGDGWDVFHWEAV